MHTLKRWSITTAAVVGFLAASSLLLAGSLVLVTELVEGREARLVAGFVLGLAFLLTIIAGIVATLHALKLTDPKAAFGLPEGSIRAIIALILILIFVMMGVYLIESVFLATPKASTEAQNAATQLLAMLGTLVTAVAAFYFGTAAVTSGTNAASAAVASARTSSRPSAITKGSAAVPGGYELVGVVNPRGLETQYFFDYGETTSYGTKTGIASAGAVNTEVEVKTPPLPLNKTWHLRLVAFNDAGTSYGLDAEVTDDPKAATDATETEPVVPEAEPLVVEAESVVVDGETVVVDGETVVAEPVDEAGAPAAEPAADEEEGGV